MRFEANSPQVKIAPGYFTFYESHFETAVLFAEHLNKIQDNLFRMPAHILRMDCIFHSEIP